MKLRRLLALAILSLEAMAASAQDTQHDVLIFGSAEVARVRGVDSDLVNFDPEKVAADVLFSLQKDSFKVFGEYLLTNHESDLERFQLGWEPSERQVVWLGRFHQASSVWNHLHHHGQFLQTSVTRPASEEWEDEGGIIPQHFVGALWESSWKAGPNHGLHTAFGGGIAPVLTEEGLEPFDLLKPNLSRHKFGAQARIAYLPRELDDTGIGLVYAHNEIAFRGERPASVGFFDHVDQTVIGLDGRYDTTDWKLQIAGYRVETWLDGRDVSSPAQTFYVGYAQIERNLPRGVDLFLRHEDTSHQDALYLQFFPKFVARRSTVGARWQFAKEHAITLEISDSRSLTERYREFRLQWSAALL